MPQYGGDIVSYAAKYFDISIFITEPDFPFNLQISDNVSVYRNEIPSGNPDCLVSCGAFTPFLKKIKKVALSRGATLIMASDNNDKEPLWKLSLKRIMSVPYRGIPLLVPGRSGRRYARGLGHNTIAEGLYASAPVLSKCKKAEVASYERDNAFIFVGQLNQRKNIETLINAFLLADLGDWQLRVVGDGPLADSLPRDAKIEYFGFMQPDEVSHLFLKSKVFVLPSHEEHWGVVVLEAAAAGCVLCLSEAVGAADDFITPLNGTVFDPRDLKGLSNRLQEMTTMSNTWYENAVKTSIDLSQAYTPDLFVKSVSQLMGRSDASY
jgi:glycosyltransferase involved in cell wall biosynthesis